MSGLLVSDEHPSWVCPPTKTNASTLINTTEISQMFRKVCDNFDKLYSRHVSSYWFIGEGIESGEMMECREDIESLMKDYDELSTASQ